MDSIPATVAILRRMQESFLQKYLRAFHRIDGWFSYDAAFMFMAYNELIARSGIAGDVLEIGVYQGLSAIAVATLRAPGARMYAVDLFEKLETDPGYGSGSNYRKEFEANMQSFFGNQDFVNSIIAAYGELKPSDLPQTFSFCHVDGGHSPEETYADLTLAGNALLSGGLLALDDYFNPQHPGVCEGAIIFNQRHPNVLKPIAIGYNKVLFQKVPTPFDLQAAFAIRFPTPEHLNSVIWNTSVHLWAKPLRSYFDVYSSTPDQLRLLGETGPRALFSTARSRVQARAGQELSVAVRVKNSSRETFPHGEGVFGLSYHLRSSDGRSIQHDNERMYIPSPLHPGAEVEMTLNLRAPLTSGDYVVEIDLVWEGIMWFADLGNPPAVVMLDIS